MADLTPQTPPQADRTQRATEMINRLFTELKAIFPAWRHAFETEADYAAAKKIWLEALTNAKITARQFKHGLAMAKQSGVPYLPSVGQFIDWCRSPNLAQYGLPDENELYRRLVQFQRYGMAEIHRFKFNSAAEYWLITDLHVRCRLATEADLRREIRASLKTMGERLAKGEIIPEPQIALPQTPSFKPWEQQRQQNLSGIAKCRNALRGRA